MSLWASDWAYFRALHAWLPEPFFQTSAFLTFAAFVFAIYWLIPRRWNDARVLVLVLASIHFYAAWNAGLAFLVLGTSIIDYLLGRSIDAVRYPRTRKLLLAASISMNLGVLAYFKYRGFFLNEFHDLLESCGLPPGYIKLDLATLLIPFGISFYTFEAISYAVDVYRRKIAAEKSLLHFLLFILFFPHLVAGPIVRAGDFLKQASRIKRWNWLRMQIALQLFLLGVFKKFAIADRMAVFADPVFTDPGVYSTNANWLAVLAYSLRIYADFSGYSDMALGIAHLFGYRLTQNFNVPYLATNVSDFWRRWHISLSTWLRDYIFIPLGGSRGSDWITARNLITVMTLGGLWHGANWTYLVWGLYHGMLLVIHRAVSKRITLPALLAIPITFACVSLGWVFFRPEWEKSLMMLDRLFAFSPGLALSLHHRSLWWTLAVFFAVTMLAMNTDWKKWIARIPGPAMGIALAVMLCLAELLAPNTEKIFIYFTF